MRYESAVNHILADLPVSALCAWDTRTTSEAVQAEVMRSLHTVVGPGGRSEPNRHFQRPRSGLAGEVQAVVTRSRTTRPVSASSTRAPRRLGEPSQISPATWTCETMPPVPSGSA